MTEGKLVILKRFADLPEATVARTYLENQNIYVYLQGEQHANVNWITRHALGGLNLMVLEKDFEQANKLLEKAHSNYQPIESESRSLLAWVVGLVSTLGFNAPIILRKKDKD